MIKLTVEDYCQNCPLFEAEVEKLTAYGSTCERHAEGFAYTVIRCEHAERCAAIAGRLRKEFGNG